jgi:hypothetical protein
MYGPGISAENNIVPFQEPSSALEPPVDQVEQGGVVQPWVSPLKDGPAVHRPEFIIGADPTRIGCGNMKFVATNLGPDRLWLGPTPERVVEVCTLEAGDSYTHGGLTELWTAAHVTQSTIEIVFM